MRRFAKTTVVVAAVICAAGICLGTGTGSRGGFAHGIIISVDGEDYYLAGAPDGPNGEYDIPGHYWVITGEARLVGKHYNTGPFGASSWWSSNADDGELLYNVNAVIDTWSEIKAIYYISQGFVHYHELITVSDGELHPSKVVWLKHIARTSFVLDGGPHPELSHEVNPGVDLDFIPNALNPYTPGAAAMADSTVELLAEGRGDGPVIYVTSQGLYYDSIVKADLPPNGPFQLLELGPNGLQTEFGPGDVGYVGGRWWKDDNGNGEMDEGETFMCPLLPPGREMP